MSCVNVRGCRIGEGRPKVILPIVERTEAAILEKAVQFSTLSADCVEWRVDWFEGFQSPAAIARCVQKLRVALRDKLLLVTFRTKAEGGEQALSHPEYLAFLRLILDTDCADLLDIEFFTAGADLPALVEQAHSAGVAVVCSSHDFATTPTRAELVSRMVQMQQAGADLPKLAVMPTCRTDVLELLAAASWPSWGRNVRKSSTRSRSAVRARPTTTGTACMTLQCSALPAIPRSECALRLLQVS